MPEFKITITRTRLVWEITSKNILADSESHARDLARSVEISAGHWYEEDSDLKDWHCEIEEL